MIDEDTVKADFSIPRSQRFLRGLAIISKYETDPDFAAAHDCFYFGSYEKTIALMTDDEMREMFAYNWTEDQDSWVFFT